MLIYKNRIRIRNSSLKKRLSRNIEKVRKNYITQSAEQTLKSFCKETTIHGFRFLFDDTEKEGSSKIDEFFRTVRIIVWLICDLLGAGFAIFLMILVWNRFENTPTITTVETNNYPIWYVPFPGVTICNVNAVYKPNTKNIAAKLLDRGFSNSTIEEYFKNLDALVTFRPVKSEFLKISSSLTEMGYTSERIMFELTHPCEQLLRDCNWQGKSISCKNLFRTAKSSEGFCCSFNYKALRSQFEIKLHRILELCIAGKS